MLYNDDAFATMLLVSRIAPDKEELARPLSFSEYYQLRGEAERLGLRGLGQLIGLDVSGMRRALDIPEAAAYRLCVLLNRAMPLSYALERFADGGVHIVTVAEPHYPSRLIERLREKAPPMLYLCGTPLLAEQQGIAVVGEPGHPQAAECVRELTRGAKSAGLHVIAGDEPGAGRVAEDESMRCEGRYVLFLAGAMMERIYQPGISEMIAGKRALAMSVVHPEAQYTVNHALERNKCLYALADAAFVLGIEKERGAMWDGACSAMRNRWSEHIYAMDDPQFQGSRRLIARGATAFSRFHADELRVLKAQWSKPVYEQLSLFD